jgi:DNA-directed RNA polymerase specialized sigma24 family protein
VKDPEADDPGALCESKAMRRQLVRSIESLGPNRRLVLRLYLAGMSVDEISVRVRWDRAKVRHFLYRGIDEIRAKVRSGGEPSAPLARREGPTR